MIFLNASNVCIHCLKNIELLKLQLSIRIMLSEITTWNIYLYKNVRKKSALSAGSCKGM